MNLHEYQGKSILKKYKVAVPYGIVAFTPEEAVKAAEQIQDETGSDKWAVKAQIHAGGRGKGLRSRGALCSGLSRRLGICSRGNQGGRRLRRRQDEHRHRYPVCLHPAHSRPHDEELRGRPQDRGGCGEQGEIRSPFLPEAGRGRPGGTGEAGGVAVPTRRARRRSAVRVQYE